MPITESKKDKLKIEDIRSASADMAQAKIELALLRYKVVVERGEPVAEQKKKVRL